MYVIPGALSAPPTLVWLSRDGVYQSVLQAVPDVTPQPSASPAASPSGPLKATPTPTKKP